MNEAFSNWFAGFVAGEGSFTLYHRPGTKCFAAELSIQLRDDDLDILLEIQENLQAGTVSRYRPRNRDWNPLAQWAVRKRSECFRIVQIFDAHPLRAKKQRDFLIWREAVLELQKSPEQRDTQKLLYLQGKLRFTRNYKGPNGLQEYLPCGVQLSLPGTIE